MSAPKLRCAIYTRKSSEEGLEQDFNSLHAQREACEAYVLSQRAEGWTTIRAAYDDGGFSGGSMDRPGLKALLADIEAGRIDVVVVYKVDRLTRSLTDFARIVEAFDAKGISFVSVTQAFNTTSSMGRLTLNVLLSFAQFEREVTGERIRDKIAASKAKGIFMGGNPALGYDIDARRLIINPAEAGTVRHIFRRYLELGTVNALRLELERDGVRSKSWTAQSGRRYGDKPLSRGALFHLLKNRLFLGEIVHKGRIYSGQHEAIIDRYLFDDVQRQLAQNTADRRASRNRASAAPLRGLLFDEDGDVMSPTFGTGKGGKTFRYYVSAPVQQGVKAPARGDAVYRVSGPQMETLIAERLHRLSLDGPLETLRDQIIRIEVMAHCVRMLLRGADLIARYPDRERAISDLSRRLADDDQLSLAEDDALSLTIAVRPVFRGGRTWLVNTTGDAAKPVFDRRLIAALRSAHAWLAEAGASPVANPRALHTASGVSGSYARKVTQFAFLAPDIQPAILEGRQPPGLSFTRILQEGVPLAWADQRARFGFAQFVGGNSH